MHPLLECVFFIGWFYFYYSFCVCVEQESDISETVKMATGIRDPSESTYTFTSQPRAVVPQRRKYRDAYDPNASVMQPCNIMYDPRVIRGNTYRQQQLLNGDIEDQQDNPVDAQRQQEARRKRQARARAQERLKAKDIEPVPGRQHIEVQTELYVR